MKKDNIIEIEIVEKFNPYHDPKNGRFTDGKGMSTFSANPDTKAGAAAIKRETERQQSGSKAGHEESKPKQDKKQSAPESKTQGHQKAMMEDMTVDDEKQFKKAVSSVQKELNCTAEEAELMVYGVNEFTVGSQYVRHIQQGNSKSDLGNKAEATQRAADGVELYIEKAPKWDGGELYRGISVDNAKAKSIIESGKAGKLIDMMGTSSWTSDKEVADGFSNTVGNSKMSSIVFKTAGTKQGTSATKLSFYGDWQQEVIISKNAKWKFGEVTKSVNQKGVTVYEVELIEQ